MFGCWWLFFFFGCGVGLALFFFSFFFLLLSFLPLPVLLDRLRSWALQAGGGRRLCEGQNLLCFRRGGCSRVAESTSLPAPSLPFSPLLGCSRRSACAPGEGGGVKANHRFALTWVSRGCRAAAATIGGNIAEAALGGLQPVPA